MAFGNETDVQLRPELATNRTPIDFGVEQSAAAHLADAFRQGLVNADDIIERYGTLAKSKEKMQIQGIDEFLNPDAIQARQQQVRAAQVDAELKSSPEYQATQEAIFRDTLNKANAGDHGAMRQTMISQGWTVPEFDQNAGWTDDVRKKTSEAFQEFVNYKDSLSAAKAELDGIKTIMRKEETKTIKNGQLSTVVKDVPVHVDSSGIEVDDKEYQKVRKFAAMSPNMWRHMGRPQFGELSGIKPGKFGGGLSGPLSEPEVSAKAPATVTKPPLLMPPPTTTVTTIEQPGIVTGVKTEPVDKSTVKGPTEAQQRAQLALARFSSANDVFEHMKVTGYDPTTVTSWVNSFLPEILKGGDRKTYDAAVDAWSQGLLRLESGAAISRQEKSWYDKAFFPQVGDPPVVVTNKEKMRHDIESMVGEIAEAGGVSSPESEAQKAKLKKTYQEAGSAVGAPPKGVGFSGTTPAAPVVTRTGRKFVRDPNSPTGWSLAP